MDADVPANERRDSERDQGGKEMTQEVLKLAEDYAKNRANYHIESLYGTNESYTATIKKAMLEAHQALKEALAQTQEPVAYYHPHKGFYFAKPTSVSAPITVDVEPLALYTTPPQRTEQLKACVYCGQLVAKEKNV